MKTPSGLGAGEAVLAMIRPEKLRIDRTGTPARVTDVVFAGEKITYFLDSPLGTLTAVTPNDGGADRGPGAEVAVSWRPEDVLLFPHKV